ncbi:hypothetical protein [Amycolatopsis sp. NBC_01480]|uniref:hypothetical protein n=1 Tax=Amycolatopsis sp. NBC_01480 TaxID=2903562 RepID=UPI002E2C34D2|nr:hypothetical protein [Amycolatopsis sp. NBC_01480]
MTLSTIWENADHTTVAVDLYTADEALDQLGGEPEIDGEIVLAIGGDSGGYFGLEGKSANIRLILLRALDLLAFYDENGVTP